MPFKELLQQYDPLAFRQSGYADSELQDAVRIHDQFRSPQEANLGRVAYLRDELFGFGDELVGLNAVFDDGASRNLIQRLGLVGADVDSGELRGNIIPVSNQNKEITAYRIEVKTKEETAPRAVLEIANNNSIWATRRTSEEIISGPYDDTRKLMWAMEWLAVDLESARQLKDINRVGDEISGLVIGKLQRGETMQSIGVEVAARSGVLEAMEAAIVEREQFARQEEGIIPVARKTFARARAVDAIVKPELAGVKSGRSLILSLTRTGRDFFPLGTTQIPIVGAGNLLGDSFVSFMEAYTNAFCANTRGQVQKYFKTKGKEGFNTGQLFVKLDDLVYDINRLEEAGFDTEAIRRTLGLTYLELGLTGVENRAKLSLEDLENFRQLAVFSQTDANRTDLAKRFIDYMVATSPELRSARKRAKTISRMFEMVEELLRRDGEGQSSFLPEETGAYLRQRCEEYAT